jgi:AraC-like DNA-binding protein
MVSSASLKFFEDIVRDNGGDPASLLRSLHIDPAVLKARDTVIPYRSVVRLLERAAAALQCPDFGLQLARRQYADGILGALDIAMRNSPTVGDAWQFCIEHVHVYCADTRLSMRRCDEYNRHMMRFDILLPGSHEQRQVTELSLLISHLATKLISGGQAVAREIWFAHQPLSTSVCYADYFDGDVRFGRPYNALFFAEDDLAAPVIGRNEHVFELATYFLHSQFPRPADTLESRVRRAIEEQLRSGRFSHVEVAATLCMHPRTLQRQLHAFGENFEAIKDEVRRDAALRYLQDTQLPLKTIAAMLGYSDTSVLIRCCRRWFGHPPGALRQFRARVH